MNTRILTDFLHCRLLSGWSFAGTNGGQPAKSPTLPDRYKLNRLTTNASVTDAQNICRPCNNDSG